MGSIDNIKPQFTAVNKSHQHHEKISWELRESNPGLLGEKQVCYFCAMHRTQKITFVSVSENPGENSVAVLLVVDPVALVRLEQHRVVDREVKDPVAVGRPVLPLPEVLVAVGGRVSSQACKGDRD